MKVIAYGLCGLLVGIASCAREETAVESGPKQVRAAEVVSASLPDEVSGFGSLSYARKTEIAAPSEATVGSLPFREGEALRSGTVAVVLANPQIALAIDRAESAVSQAEAALALANARLREGEYAAEARIRTLEKSEAEYAQGKRELTETERKHADQERLYAAGGIAEETIRQSRFTLASSRDRVGLMEKSLEIERIGLRDGDLSAAGYMKPKSDAERIAALIRLSTETLRAETAAASSRVEAAKKEEESARLAASELSIASPASGVVGARHVEVGERVAQGGKLLTIISDDSLFAVFAVREAEALRLRKGMDAVVKVESAGAEFPGTVDLVSPTADAQSASFSVRILLRDPKRRLKPGMFVRVAVRAGPPREVLVVPESAPIEKSEGESSVFVIADGRLIRRSIALGAVSAQGREVVSGLRIGEVVVDRPDAGLREADYVVVAD